MNWKYYKRWNDIEEILAAFRRWKREDTEKIFIVSPFSKKTNVHKIFTKKELYPIFLVDMGSLFPSYLLKSPSFDGKMMEIFLS